MNSNSQNSEIIVKSSRKMVKTSVKKLYLVANLIRGMDAQKALLQMKFLNKRNADVMHDVLFSGISNAENNFNIDADSLIIKDVRVGKDKILKRFMARGRGKGARVIKHYSKVEILLQKKA